MPFSFPFSLFLSLERQTKMNFKLQAKKTPFQRHKEEQELKRKVNLEGEKERGIHFVPRRRQRKKTQPQPRPRPRSLSLRPKHHVTAGRGGRGQGLRGLCRRLWRRRRGPQRRRRRRRRAFLEEPAAAARRQQRKDERSFLCPRGDDNPRELLFGDSWRRGRSSTT